MAHILIVEDEERLRDLLGQILEGMGHTHDPASNGVEGCERVALEEYDLILTDVRMPKMDGIQFLRKIEKQVAFCTPCIIITALAHEPSVSVAAVRLAYDFLAKPFELPQVEEAVRRGLELREAWLARRRDMEHLQATRQRLEAELREASDGALMALAAMLEGKDLHQEGEEDGWKLEVGSYQHCRRVKDLCAHVARELHLPDAQKRQVDLGAMLHDVGKYRIPDKILFKPGPLTREEWAVMRKHPAYGAEFVRLIPFLADAADVVLHHHERWDGTGYPDGLSGTDIPLAARIFAVVDAFDAITSPRCYREKRSYEEALLEIQRCRGTQFDPLVVAAFLRVVRALHGERAPEGAPGGNGRSLSPRPAASADCEQLTVPS